MTIIVQGNGYIIRPKATKPPGTVLYGVKLGTWKLTETDQAKLEPQGQDQATAKITANVDTTTEKLHVQCEVYTDPAKTKTIVIAVVLDDQLAEATEGEFEITPFNPANG